MGGTHHHHHGHMGHGHQPKDAHSYPELNFGVGSKWIKNLTKDRVKKFTDGSFASLNLPALMFTHRIDDADHVKLEVWSAPGRTKPTFEEAMKQDFKPAKKGQEFGPSWVRVTNHWWKITVKIPAEWEKYERVQFEFDPGCEAMIFTTSGVPLQGITGGFEGDRRVEFILDKTKREYSFVIESSCNGMFGISGIAPPDQNRYFTLASADLVVPNQDAWHLFWDFTTLREIIDTLPGNSPLQNIALRTANEIMNEFQVDDPDTIAKCRKIAENVFGANWAKEGADVYQKRREGHGADREQVWGIGHCHIDTAWLWPYSVTQQKVARSWSTQVDLMNRYPEHHFTCSSAQQYKWLEQLYPSLFEEVKSKIKQGLFEPIGGAWVEHDGNMPSGEAFIRQMTFGQRFFQSRFGIRCRTGWLPDSFGLSGSIPQLMRSAGMQRFFTQKLSWNNVNVFPHSTFNWVGIDGTQILCHMTPVDTYTAQATTGDVRKAVTNHKNLESSDMGLLVFGNGDGGGGPLAKMLENLRRVRAAGNNSRELPLVNMGHTTEEFFDRLEKESGYGSALPNWHGELYLEFHRGTYTSHGSIKRGNRKSEILLRDVELVATLASLTAGYLYPKQRIDDSWEKLLLNQFHDVLPGSAIGMVYEDAEKLYSEITKECKSILEEAFDTLLVGSTPIDLNTPFEISTPGKVLAVNTTPFPRREVVQVPLRSSGDKSLRTAAVQITSDSQTGYVLMDARDGVGIAQPIGLFADVKPVSGKFRKLSLSADFILKNSTVCMTISKGRIVSLVDVQLDRELIAPGKTGGLIIFSDQPNYWDAWDVEIHHLEKFTQLEFNDVRILENGPVRASVEAQVKYGQSLITTTISLDAITSSLSPQSRSFIRFDAKVDWHQRHEILKFEIPLDIRGLEATYECQFGHVSRPTHRNTTWDTAKFEVCGHKYADFSEYGYGVALLSESKYGFAVTGNVLRVSLLRAATSPDAEQDQGEHSFSWAVLPHLGHFLESDVPQVAYTFNSPLHLRYVPDQGSDGYGAVSNLVHKPLFNVTGAPNVILETVKRGDDDDFSTNSKGERTIVLRLYEAFGGHARASLNVSKKLKVSKAAITNVLEDHIEDLKVDNSDDQVVSFPLKFRGFEVVTVKLTVSLNKAQHKSSSSGEGWVQV
ncbi:Alpha mannosidase, middle domain [Rhizoctonia solani]|uniref:Alpha-mannosidase n=1 Tax=Rhizoctonia solani TaxID=456999 RepID=A0A8H7LGW5_9AGAM|nr:Alpha mannosidase, middle domain [Rhizoctonia solani]